MGLALEKATDKFFEDFRIPVPVEDFFDRPMFLSVNGYAFCRGYPRKSWKLLISLPKIFFAYLKMLPRLIRNLDTQWREEGLPEYQAVIEQWEAQDPKNAASSTLLAAMREISIADAIYWFWVSIAVAGAKVTDGMLHAFLRSRWVASDLPSGAFLRGFASKTLEGQVALESIATEIRNNPDLLSMFLHQENPQTALRRQADPEARRVSILIDEYLEIYGKQVFNFDFVEETVMENPWTVFASLRGMLSSDAINHESRHQKLVDQRDAQIAEMTRSLGPVRRRIFKTLLRWASRYGPAREEALFYTGSGWLTLRRYATELGERLKRDYLIEESSDVFYLRERELEEFCEGNVSREQGRDFRKRVANRRSLREAQRCLHPPGIVPLGARWKMGPLDLGMWETQKRNESGDSELTGFPVSPGRVTGEVVLIQSTEDFDKMKAGCILVCPTTTPAWTPLFRQAIGLVTDMGGILAHGSIVAREYGIPAVLGTGKATQVLRDGQPIQVDGNRGVVTLLDRTPLS